jgi:hypothetical protein
MTGIGQRNRAIAPATGMVCCAKKRKARITDNMAPKVNGLVSLFPCPLKGIGSILHDKLHELFTSLLWISSIYQKPNYLFNFNELRKVAMQRCGIV